MDSLHEPLHELYNHCRDYIQNLPERHRHDVVEKLLQLLEKDFILNKATTTARKRLHAPSGEHQTSQKRPRTNAVSSMSTDVVPRTTRTNVLAQHEAPANMLANIPAGVPTNMPTNVPTNVDVHTTPEALLDLVSELSKRRHELRKIYAAESLREIYDRIVDPVNRVVGLCLQYDHGSISSTLGSFLGITTFALLCNNNQRRTFARRYAENLPDRSPAAVMKNTSSLERALIAGEKALALERIAAGTGFLATHCKKKLARLSLQNINKAAIQIEAMEDSEYLLKRFACAFDLLKEYCESMEYYSLVKMIDHDITERRGWLEESRVASPIPSTVTEPDFSDAWKNFDIDGFMDMNFE